ncbi:hypothetical protein FHN55_10545 [Streptomyces sp. NP160]|uniref:hypothetical protein n=1 Tax=Streptomyces sp. NP160 TaxID=2586637 RepID=UPI001117FF1A|nr:hypothetical protein [Streptomyces sp. NP160]TNM67478.1 hypothetical protein FHN55_10545 [Streptomyces sp. NP160]
MGDTTTAGATERLGTRDLLWSGTRTSIVLGPLDLPPHEDLVAAAGALAEAFPAARLGQALDASRGRWVAAGLPVAQLARRAVLVHDGPGPDEVGLSAFARALEAHRTDDVPVRWVVAGRHLALLICHAAGDGGLMLGLPAALLEVARTGRPPAWTQQPDLTSPLLRALAHHYGRHPRRVALTLAAVRAAAAASSATSTGAGGGGEQDDDAGRALLRPSTTAVHAVMGEAQLAELTAWRRAQGKGTSGVAVQTVLVGAALAAVGLPPQGPPTVLVDARRYLPPGAAVHGNFVAGLQLPVGERWDAREITTALRSAVEAARPLSAMTLGAARQLLPRTRAARTATGERVPARPRPVLAVTSMQHPALADLPWDGPAARATATSVSTPAPAEGVTASLTELRGHLNLSLSFHGAVYDTARMAEAVRLATGDPVAVLERAASRRAEVLA